MEALVSQTRIVDAANQAGFVLVGFARLRRLENREEYFRDWLASDHHASMEYLARDPRRRLDPRALNARFKSVVSLGYPYSPPQIPRMDWRAEMRGRIAAYALGPDYHDYVLRAAKVVADTILTCNPGAIVRAYVDTGPVLEREWGAESRLGWFGKNTMLLNRDRGSYFFLAEIFTNLELDAPVQPYREHCGTCRRCLDLCPTGALADGYVLDSRLCISYQTIENRGPIPRELRSKLGNWIFGCDICNEVCPWNAEDAAAEQSLDLMPSLPELMMLDDAGFSRRFSKSAVKRAKRRGLLRNAAVALGNTKNPDAVGALSGAFERDPDAMVRSHAAWALGQIGGAPARAALERGRSYENEPGVIDEIAAALETM